MKKWMFSVAPLLVTLAVFVAKGGGGIGPASSIAWYQPEAPACLRK